MNGMKRIVAATDFSHGGESALRRAVLLAKATGAAVEVVHAVYLPPLEEAWRKLADQEGFSEASLLEAAARRLGDLAAAVGQRLGLAPASRVLQGRPPQALAAWARESGADLIVIGAHGEHFLLDLFVGSTAMKTLRLATVPVLLVKQTPPFDYERIVIATDFSPSARAAAELAATLFPAADLHLFHAYEVPFEREMYYAGADDEAVDHYRRLGEAEARRQIEAFADSLADPRRYLRKMRHGYAPALINKYAAEIGADLVVMGSQGMSGIEATLLGSVSSHLVTEFSGDLLLVPAVGRGS